MKKIAILSDVHGNYLALAAVLEKIASQDVADIWFLGDLLLPGPGGEELFQLLEKFKVTTYVRGNWEDCILDALAGKISLTDPSDIYLGKLVATLYPQLSSKTKKRLAHLPFSLVKEVEGLRIGLFHGGPKKNYGRDLFPTQKQENFDELCEDSTLDIILTGHSHQQFMRYSSQGQVIINPGTVGQPFIHWRGFKKDFYGQYLLLTLADKQIISVEFKKVAYDVLQEIKRAEKINFPFWEFYAEFFKEGYVHTHDGEILQQHPQYPQYVEDVKKFLKELSLEK